MNVSTPEETQDAVLLTIEDGIAVVTMARPKQRNPFTAEFLRCMERIVDEVSGRDDIDVLILTGSDGVFCGGGDVKGMVERQKAGGGKPDALRKRLYDDINGWVQKLRNIEIPVIAAVDGPAFGGGLGIALCADFVLASEKASFCAVFCRIGVIPDCGVLYTLPRMIGVQKAKELIYTGRPVDALEAKDLGIVMSVHTSEDLMDEAMKIAKNMQQVSPLAFGITKRVLNQTFDVNAPALLEMEVAGQTICIGSDYHSDAVNRFVQKKPLRFNWEA